ncbi:hypothetical protein [Microbacterium istanbulense]|uniref:Uncharacterized protein n=1 Tax=Microbacterium istanbulense TaxID=3122049 RepID=A0ABU8LJN1_9MICO
MGHHKGNDELRNEHEAQDERRQEKRDEAFDADGGVLDEASQDERRDRGLPRD